MAIGTRVKNWWKHAVVYQIYPASFCDSNGDGVGDIPGIISKLDYIASLGVDVIWLSPMYDSPQVDMGYDISNYENVYRPYGTVEDMDTLIRESHARNIRIMLDLVINHTSDQHAWFKDSRSSKGSPKRDWYIWRPPKQSPSGERLPPNNWRSFFGGDSAWKWDDQTGEYYLHLFAEEQPDLNWENEATRRAIYESSMEFWLRRGIDGFRVDAVNVYSKPPGLPDMPVQDPKSRYQSPAPIVCNGPRMHEFLSEMNAVLAKYGAITVGELGMTPEREKVLRYVSAEAKQLDMVFQFDIVMLGHGMMGDITNSKPRNFTLPQFKVALAAIQTLIRGNDAWTTVFLENHDQARSVSRFADDRPPYRAASARLLALMQACLSGTQYLYQGQEIGLVNAPKASYPLENYHDVGSRLFMDAVRERHGADNAAELDNAFDALQRFARDHSRIPMPWSSRALYGGFSAAAEQAGKIVNEPWMKPHPLAGEINVEAQLGDPDSVLGFWKRMIAFRCAHPDLLVYSDYRGLRMGDKDTLLFVKEPQSGSDKVLVMLNFSTEEKRIATPDAAELGFADRTDLQFKLLEATHGNKEVGDAFAPLEGRTYLVTPE